MYIDIIDTENTGLDYVKQLAKGHNKNIRCFTKNPGIIKFCNANNINYVSSYPLGKNQADFKIISQVSIDVSKMSNIKRSNTIVRLHTGDKGLSLAVQNECDWLGVAFKNPCITEEVTTDFDVELMQLLAKKATLDSIAKSLKAHVPFLLQKIASLYEKKKVKVILQAA
ncbi:hypothetical protein LMH73_024670 [Vibrio splendidus]|nr:hypothetical protein [Vibrio splendidus]MCC4880730.1 hypothetical protein [Vibrio splendidus]